MAANAFQAEYLKILGDSPYIRSVAKPGRKIIGLETYVYNAVVGAAGTLLTRAAGPVSTTLDIHADSDFVMTYLSASVNFLPNGDMKVNRNVTLQVQDTATGKLFFNVPTIITLVAGGGGFPFIFPAPRVVNANTTLLITMQDRDALVDYNNGFVAFGGTRIFYDG